MFDLADLWAEEVAFRLPYNLDRKGYAIVRAPECPLAWSRGRMARCRYVAWAMGWLTERGQVVHHKDFDKLNDRPSNLLVVTPEQHQIIHKIRPPGTGEAISRALKGRKVPEEVKRKIAATLKARYESGELQVVITEAQKEQIRKALTGKPHPADRRKAISEGHKGIPCSDAAKEKLRAAHTGRVITWGDKISAALKEKGIRPSAEALERSAAKRRGVPLSEAQREASRAGARKRWDRERAALDARAAEWAELRAKGLTLRGIAAQYGVSAATVHRTQQD